MKPKNSMDQIAAIAAEMASITEFAEGSLTCSSNYYTLKSGKRIKSKPHYKFQSLGARGKRKYRNVPQGAVAHVRRLIENGKRYRKLEAEYSRLVTEESLSALKKSADD